MNTAHGNVDQIFWNALQLDSSAERSRYLDTACHGDPRLRNDVERLLRVQSKVTIFLETPLAEPFTRAVLDFGAGRESQIGPYRLLDELGEGGFGVVYRAEQLEPVRRLVALKLLKPGMDTRQIVARFEAERQALAIMDHPNIARVFDGGATAAGRPYFVMELVQGIPLTQFCDARALGPRQRIELLITICQAVQHAHQKGIIHRDLKPSNILVAWHDGMPVPKVIDFGIAKATSGNSADMTLLTSEWQMIGTPLYMSPEQTGLERTDIDTRSDIYSLGAVLYELLTGTTLFERERFQRVGPDEMRRIIREDEPPTPSSRLLARGTSLTTWSKKLAVEPTALLRFVRGELDWIVTKSLEKDRERRYASASDLAADLQRYLRNEPVLAGPPSNWYRCRKFVRRHRTFVATAVALTTLLLLGSAGIALSLARARQAEQAARQAARAEAEQRRKAESAYAQEVRQRRQARQAVDDMYTQVAEEWLAEQPRLQKVQRDFLEKALTYYQEFSLASSDDPQERLATAVAFRRLGRIQKSLGQIQEADAALGHARTQLEHLVTEFPTVREYRANLADTLHEQGLKQMYANQQTEAVESFRAALKTFEQIAAEFGVDTQLKTDFAITHHNLGLAVSGMLGGELRTTEGIEYLQRSVEFYRNLAADLPESPKIQSGLAATLNDWSMLLLADGQHEQAKQLVQEAIAFQRAATTLRPRQPTYRMFLSNHLAVWAELLERDNKLDQAIGAAREALALQQALATDYPDFPHYRHAQAERARDLGHLLSAENPAESESCYAAAIAILASLSDTFDDVPVRRKLLVMCYREVAHVLQTSGRVEEAESQLVLARQWQPGDLQTLHDLGRNLLVAQHNYAEAETVWRDYLQIAAQQRPDDWETFKAQVMLAASLMGQERHAEAEPLFLTGFAGLDRLRQVNPEVPKLQVAEAASLLAQLYQRLGDADKEAEWRKKLMDVWSDSEH